MNANINIPGLLICGLLLVACGGDSKTPPNEVATEQVNPIKEGQRIISTSELHDGDTRLVSLSTHEFPSTIQATGSIDVPPTDRASINALMGGYVKKFSLMEGQQVQKGDLLLTLENMELVELQQEYLEVMEQLKFLESDYQRQQSMLEENITSQKNFLRAESDFKTALARTNGLRTKLQLLGVAPKAVEEGRITSEISIHAPITGKLSQVNVSRGSYVSPEQSIAQIINSEHLLLELQLFERDLLRVQEGQLVQFSIPEISREDFQAEVSLVGRVVDPSSRTITLHARIPDSLSGRFAVGMFVNARIQGSSQSLPSLPEEAILGTGENSYVLVVKDRKQDQILLETIPVTRGILYNGFREISNPQALEGREVLVGDITP